MRTSIYRTREGRDAIAAWCRDQLDGWSTPHTTSVIPTPLGDTFTVTAGTGSHVLLLPGTNFPTSSWLPVVGVLASGYTVVAVDVPGQPGLSAGDRPKDFVAAYGDWLRALIEALNIEPVVVAHSMGAVIALAGAGRGAPVTSLVLFNPAGLARLSVRSGVLAATVPWLLRPTAATASRLLGLMSTQPVPPHLTEWMTLVGRHVRTSFAPAPLSAEVLGRVRIPVTVYAGLSDPFLRPAALRKGALRVPGARVEQISGGGHLLPQEQPDVVLGAVHMMR